MHRVAGQANGGRVGGGGGDRTGVGRTVAEKLRFITETTRKWSPEQLLHEFSGPNHDNFVACVSAAHEIDPPRFWKSLLPSITSPLFLTSLRKADVNKVLMQLQRPEPALSLNNYIILHIMPEQTASDAFIAELQQLLTFLTEMLDRSPESLTMVRPAIAQIAVKVQALFGTNSGAAGAITGRPDAMDVQAARRDRIMHDVATLQLKVDHHVARQQQEAARANGTVERGPPAEVPPFRDVSVLPVANDILADAPARLPVNRVAENGRSGRFDDLESYLGTHFHLLRDIQNLRSGVQAFRADPRHGDWRFLIFVYDKVRVVLPAPGRRGLGWTVSFKPFQQGGRRARPVDWRNSRRLLTGNLLCLVPADEPPAAWNTIVFATVLQREVDLLVHKDGPFVTIEIASNSVDQFDPAREWIFFESGTYFEPYRHVLEGLQNLPSDPTRLAFVDRFMGQSKEIRPPAYLLRPRNATPPPRGGTIRTTQPSEYIFAEAFPSFLRDTGRETQDVLADWPDFDHGLDASQLHAVKMSLRSDVALIVGPPGCGKTHVGTLLSKLLLSNASSDRPLLYVALTNHALDALLEKLLPFESNIVRVGGRSKSEALEAKNIASLRGNSRMGDRRAIAQAMSAKEAALKELQAALDLGQITAITREDLARLISICPWAEDQVQSLLSRSFLVRSTYDTDIEDVGADEDSDGWQEQRGRAARRRRLAQQNARANMDLVERWLHEGPMARRPAVVQQEVVGNVENVEDVDPAFAEDDEVNVAAEEDRRLDELGGVEQRSHRNALLERLRVVVGRHNQRRGRRDMRDMSADLDILDPVENTFADRVRAWEREAREIFLEHQQAAGVRRPNRVLVDADSDDEFDGDEPLRDDEQLMHVEDVWALTLGERRRLAQLWIQQLRAAGHARLGAVTARYKEACDQLEEIDRQADAAILRKARVIGMTTTGAARSRKLLELVAPPVVVVEEAAELLEGQILASLPLSAEQIILIGDHNQLRPKTESYQLCVRNRLDISLFERLILNDLPHGTLSMQHRMRPEISALLTPSVYRELFDHPSVFNYPPLRGFAKNLVFFGHEYAERGGGAGDESKSHENEFEAAMMVATARYLLRNGYRPDQLVLLTTYEGQQRLMRRLVQTQVQIPKLAEIRLTTVDNYQGEESDVVLLSLVRSGGKVGFIKERNRACVAMSRAKHAMIVFGDAELLRESPPFWPRAIEQLEETDALVHALPLRCELHPNTITEIAMPGDFVNVADGGCNLPCESRLDCGHMCRQRCHPDGHEDYNCLQPCARVHQPCAHQCSKRCWEDCGPCRVPVRRIMPSCGHEQEMPCSETVENWVCRSRCAKRPPGWTCDHPCPAVCGQPCPSQCTMRIQGVPVSCPAGHVVKVPCHIGLQAVKCEAICNATLDCGHRCGGKCGECTEIATQPNQDEDLRSAARNGVNKLHMPCMEQCKRPLICGHECSAKHPCAQLCPPCRRRPCETTCEHSRCNRSCGQSCAPCLEPCASRCVHDACTARCSEPCTRSPCNEPCELLLECGHPCIGLCGEVCPDKCRVCDADYTEPITFLALEDFDPADRFIQLRDCGHVFEVTGFDKWMETQDVPTGGANVIPQAEEDEQPGPKKLQMPFCPTCRTPIRRLFRYHDTILRCETAINRVKETTDADSLLRRLMHIRQARGVGPAITEARRTCRHRPDWPIGFALLGDLLRPELNRTTERETDAQLPAPEQRRDEAIGHLEHALELLPQLPERDRPRWRCFVLGALGASLFSRNGPGDVRAAELLEEAQRLMRNSDNDGATEQNSGIGSLNAASVEAMLARIAGNTVQRREHGYYYTCPNGHAYLIGECGGAMEVSTCPDCGVQVGGQGHRLLANNRRAAELDGRGATAWDRAIGQEPDPEMVRRIELGLE